jgi:hypothetical protein
MPMIATHEDSALVAAMAREALADASSIEGAELTEREARALWDLEAMGTGRIAS